MIFPLHFSSRDNDLVIMSEDNRHYSRQSWQLMASSFTLEIKVNKIFFIFFSPFSISQETSQLCLNQLPETVRSSAPSSLLDVPMATSLAEVKGITDRYLIFFSPAPPPSSPLYASSEKLLLSNLWGAENCHWATQPHLLCLMHLKSLS